MAILPAGSFIVAERRKAIPVAVKLAVMARQRGCSTDGVPFTVEDAMTGNIQFDHNLALDYRPFDTGAGDFIPPQNDPASIFATRKAQHLQKTTGRKEGATHTVTTRGSDVGEAARIRSIAAGHEEFRRRVLAKPCGHKRKPTGKIKGRSSWPQGRGFQQRKAS